MAFMAENTSRELTGTLRRLGGFGSGKGGGGVAVDVAFRRVKLLKLGA